MYMRGYFRGDAIRARMRYFSILVVDKSIIKRLVLHYYYCKFVIKCIHKIPY